ncbi:MAG: ABC transporter substrate-binding protein [Defluviimonas sp.]|uniref:ABC transporter substrate-binding protein n=1 Tax=Albidovulum sp. TaxID=1872424 RepID=UPI002A2C5AAC|nr:ABC transporter substrate-binding protein [Defluviimonas sp.]
MLLNLRRWMLAAGLGVASLGLTGPAAAQETTFVFATSEVGVSSYNPIPATLTNAAFSMIYDTLVVQDSDLSYHPSLAESWEEAPDGMAWTFHLKPGVTFHNGRPFNAATVVKWIDLFRGSENSYMIDAVASVEAVDDLTVRFVMKNPDPNLLFNLSSSFMGIPDPEAVAELGEDFGITEAIGTGPFKLESFTQGQETVLVRNDDYTWGSPLSANKGPAHIARITFREIAEDSTAYLELKSGGVDALMSIPTDYLGEIKAEPELAVAEMPGQEVFYMAINVAKDPFTDLKVRQAAALAINQKEILDNVFGGYGKEAHNFLISALPESKLPADADISYDPAKAAALLDEAGWVLGADGVRAKDGQRLSVALWTQSDSIFRRLTEVVQAELKAVGIEAKITTFDSSTIKDEFKSGNQQLAVRSYFWPNADIVDWFFSAERLGYPNTSMFNDPKAEELRVKAMTGSATQEERIANFTAYHEYVTRQFPYAPIYQPVQNMAYNIDRIEMPAEIHATQITGVVMVDVKVKE